MKTYKELFFEKLGGYNHSYDAITVENAIDFMLKEIEKDNDRIMDILKRKS